MTRTGLSRTRTSKEATTEPTTMRVIVPLQGVVQGRGGLVLGSVIPCALFYFLQLYLRRRHRSAPNPPPAPEEQLPELTVLSRSLSRAHLSPRGAGGPAYVSGRASLVAKSGDSPCDVGLRKVSEDPYDESRNPDGVIQLELAENKLSLDLVRDWMVENARDAILGGGRSGGELSIGGIANYQPFDGLMELKVADSRWDLL